MARPPWSSSSLAKKGNLFSLIPRIVVIEVFWEIRNVKIWLKDGWIVIHELVVVCI